MKKLRVGIFTEVYHPTMNGVVVSIDTFKHELSKLGVESIIFAPARPRAPHEENVIRLPAFPFHPDYPTPIPFLSSTFTAIENQDLDLVHTQHQMPTSWFGLKAARRLNIPVVATYHTLLPDYFAIHFPLPYSRNLAEWLTREYCNRADLVITPTPSMKRLLTKWGVTARLEVNPTGIYLEHYKETKIDLAHEFAIPEGRKVLLFVGRLGDEKNLRMLFKALRIVLHDERGVQLLLVGGGPQQKTYRRLVSDWGISDHVTFADFQPKEKTNHIFGAADMFVFPSTTDTQGIVITEAMAAGTPIVAVDRLGPGDIIEDGKSGLVTDDDAADFAHAILQVLSNRELAHRLVANAREEVKKYSAAATAKRQLELYESVLTKANNQFLITNS